MSKKTLNILADFMTYTMATAAIYELVRPRPYSKVLTIRIDNRIKELKQEEIRLIAARAYLIELWS